MVRFGRRFAIFLVLATVWVVSVLHRATLSPLSFTPPENISGHWFSKDEYGINQLFLWGSPYERGYAEGKLTHALMEREENDLVRKFHELLPHSLIRWGVTLGLMRWFWGEDRYLAPWMLEQMYGVSQSATTRFDSLLDRYTRQVAYHGLHEVGQMFVDFKHSDRGCTVFAVPAQGGWVVGRNFDFEGGRIFDEEKIVKWIFPSVGHRVVEVSWAGMVGLVTGVNDQGVYVSINAAGSTDFRRYGTPTTLVALDALQFAGSAAEAVERIKNATTFITDIFVVGDREHFFRVEKSPRRFAVEALTAPTVITNHLLAPPWKNDALNVFRRRELTSEARLARGETLLRANPALVREDSKAVVSQILTFLRDRRDRDGAPLPLGNRRTIDALIASHSVIYDAGRGILYVGRGPSVSGSLIGYDLKTSFAGSGPARIADSLPPDREVTPEVYARVKSADHWLDLADEAIRKGRCAGAGRLLSRAASLYSEESHYFQVEGNYEDCEGRPDAARKAWAEALLRRPAYPEDEKKLKSRLGRG